MHASSLYVNMLLLYVEKMLPYLTFLLQPYSMSDYIAFKTLGGGMPPDTSDLV